MASGRKPAAAPLPAPVQAARCGHWRPVALASFGGQQPMVTIVVDRAGLISYLVLNPYQPPPGHCCQAPRLISRAYPSACFAR
jgi:hypothetical protein